MRALKTAWAMVPAPIMQQITEFDQTYMNPSHNMKFYRTALPSPPLTTPIIPFIPLFLKVIYMH